jgi:murein DD-endopeptidase MepM/ murein hydrolase activator NlpD
LSKALSRHGARSTKLGEGVAASRFPAAIQDIDDRAAGGNRIMYGRPSSLLFAMWLLSAGASACEVIDRGADQPWLESNKPVLAEAAFLSSEFGMRMHPLLNELRMHTGVDWSASPGTPVIAVHAGRIVSVERRGMYGNIVIVDHGAGWQTLYAHLSSFAVKEGDCVKFGEVIGNVGSTGLTSGPALHFETLQYGWPTDPMSVPLKIPSATRGGR